MTNIGITTFSRTHNYGSLLQSYALQHILEKKYNLNTEFINYSNNAQREMYALYSELSSVKNVIKNIMFFSNKRYVKQHFEDFNDFFDNYLNSSSQDLRDGDGHRIKDYDFLITGSDQVWNVQAVDFDDIYFLNFNKNRVPKVAYATSLGGTNILTNVDDVNRYKNYLSEFSAVSVREANSKKWISEIYNEDEVHIAADPTLLIDKEEWFKTFDDEPLIKGKYIYYYGFKYEHEMNMKVKELGEKLGLPVYCLDAKKYTLRSLWRYGFKLSPHGGPKSFINLMRNCEVSVTTSFHGTVFSTIFEKPFFYLRVPNVPTDDDRASFLLSQLGLSSQYLLYNDIVEKSDDLFNIDYSEVKRNIKRLQDTSFKFIENEIVAKI